MKSKLNQQAFVLRQVLAKKSWQTYKDFLCRLVVDSSLPSGYGDLVVGALRNDDVDSLLDMADSLSSQKYGDAASHFAANQVAYCIKKYPFPPRLGTQNPRKVAKEKFLSSEAKCSRMNRYFQSVHDLDATVQADFHQMRSFISYVLGDSIDLPSWYQQCDFGPGSNIGIGGEATNLKRKLASDWTVTPGALHYGFAAFVQDWNFLRCLQGADSFVCLDMPVLFGRYRESCSVVSYNKIAFVPKTARTFRTIAVEPFVNSYLQKGVDNLMRSKLKRIGIDLTDQETNSYMAYLGSTWDDEESFVTIDLSSASDSVSIELCRNLLPPNWFDVLNSIRSTSFLLDGKLYPYEKFCSMGNGFCFPLETLLFTAAAKACGGGRPGRDFCVYGDDIIVRKRVAPRLLELLEVMGFSVNTDKTFIQGPFRESCGRDWFEGKDVRPFILDFAFDSLEALFKFCNLTRRSLRTEDFFSGVRSFIFDLIPDRLRFVRPFNGPADSGVDVELDVFQSSPYARWNKNYQAWTWLELHHTPVVDRQVMRRSDYSLMMAVLRGATADRPFVFRRKTRTVVRRVPTNS